jgi:hypothetical protein
VLQALGYDLGVMTAGFRHLFPDRPVDASHPDILLDFNRCILCELCVRASCEVDGKCVFALSGRGIDKHLIVNAESRTAAIVMASFAILVAPITEELIFRAGLFRYLRTRIPRWAALLLPALLFASLHGNLAAFAPLAALGIVFALAYEHTGRIAVPIIAHALFNLNTLVLLLTGVTA